MVTFAKMPVQLATVDQTKCAVLTASALSQVNAMTQTPVLLVFAQAAPVGMPLSARRQISAWERGSVAVTCVKNRVQMIVVDLAKPAALMVSALSQVNAPLTATVLPVFAITAPVQRQPPVRRQISALARGFATAASAKMPV